MKISKFKAGLLAAVFTIAFPMTAQAQEQNKTEETSDAGAIRFSTGINYSTGDYGDVSNTKVVSAPVSLKYSKNKFSIRVSTAYVRIDGPGSLTQTPEGRDFIGGRSGNSGPGSSNSGGGSGSGSSGSGSSGSGSGSGGSGSGSGGSGSGGSGSSGSGSGGSGSSGSGSTGSGTIASGGGASSKRSGFGDVSIAATCSFDLGSDFWIDATGRVKLPTASKAKRLGTGKTDFTASFDFGKDIGPATIYINGRRKFIGKNTGSTLRDVWGAGVGASVLAGEGVTLGADYDWQQSSSAGQKASSEVTGWAAFRLAKGFNLSVFASTGLNNNSADFAGGMTLSIKLN